MGPALWSGLSNDRLRIVLGFFPFLRCPWVHNLGVLKTAQEAIF